MTVLEHAASAGNAPRRPDAADRLTRAVSAVTTISAQLHDLIEAAEIALHDLDEEAAELSAALTELGREGQS